MANSCRGGVIGRLEQSNQWPWRVSDMTLDETSGGLPRHAGCHADREAELLRLSTQLARLPTSTSRLTADATSRPTLVVVDGRVAQSCNRCRPTARACRQSACISPLIRLNHSIDIELRGHDVIGIRSMTRRRELCQSSPHPAYAIAHIPDVAIGLADGVALFSLDVSLWDRAPISRRPWTQLTPRPASPSAKSRPGSPWRRQ